MRKIGGAVRRERRARVGTGADGSRFRHRAAWVDIGRNVCFVIWQLPGESLWETRIVGDIVEDDRRSIRVAKERERGIMSLSSVKPGEIEYPETDGKPMAETDRHRDLMVDLIAAARYHFQHDAEVYISGNLLLYYVEGDPRKCVAPDFFFVRGVTPGQRRIYKLWEEGVVPQLVVELTSRKTHREDLGDKRRLYEELGVLEYYLFDPEGVRFRPPLQGFRRQSDGFRAVQAEARADGSYVFSSRVLGLELHGRGDTLRFVDPERGEPVPVFDDFVRIAAEERRRADFERRRADAEGQRADEEGQRADAASQRANEECQRANVESQRADSESQRADAESQRADAESQRADAESQRADAESQRADAESQRADAESRRADAERQRADALEKAAAAAREREQTMAAEVARLRAQVDQSTGEDHPA